MATSTGLPTSRETGPLAQELKTYLAHKSDLLRQSPGKFVLIKDSEIIGLYDLDEDAFTEGYRRFHRAPFMVQRVQADFDTYVIGGSAIDMTAQE